MNLFISYDPDTDEYWRVRFEDLFGRAFSTRSLPAGEIAAQDGDDYIHQIKARGYIDDNTVMVVLVGPRTYSRSHVDWEIAAALELKGSRPTPLVAIRLPTHPDHGKKSVNPNRIPFRLADNLRSGFLNLHDWSESEQELHSRIMGARKDVLERAHLVQNSRQPLNRDLLRH